MFENNIMGKEEQMTCRSLLDIHTYMRKMESSFRDML